MWFLRNYVSTVSDAITGGVGGREGRVIIEYLHYEDAYNRGFGTRVPAGGSRPAEIGGGSGVALGGGGNRVRPCERANGRRGEVS